MTLLRSPKGGSRPIASDVRAVTGQKPKTGRNAPDEPKIDAPIPEKPQKFLTKQGRDAYIYFVTMLNEYGIGSRVDEMALSRLAELNAQVIDLTKFLDEHGYTYETETENGSIMIRKRAEVEILADADRRLIKMLIEFGLTPAARTKVSSRNGNGKKDKGDGFFD